MCTNIFVAGISKPRPIFRWTVGNSLEDQRHLTANRTEHYDATGLIRTRKQNMMENNLLLPRGGERIASIVEFTAQPSHNGRIYRCYAGNPTIVDEMGEPQGEELNTTVTIVVLCEYIL